MGKKVVLWAASRPWAGSPAAFTQRISKKASHGWSNQGLAQQQTTKLEGHTPGRPRSQAQHDRKQLEDSLPSTLAPPRGVDDLLGRTLATPRENSDALLPRGVPIVS